MRKTALPFLSRGMGRKGAVRPPQQLVPSTGASAAGKGWGRIGPRSHRQQPRDTGFESAEDPPPPLGNKRSACPGLPRPKVRATKCPSFFSLKIFYIFQTQPAIIPAVISGHGGRRKSNQPF